MIRYRDIGDYMTREEKLAKLEASTLNDDDWVTIHPDDNGDWLNQSDESFSRFIAISDEDVSVFSTHSRGVETTRDSWCYNFSRDEVAANMTSMIDVYNSEARRGVADDKHLLDDERQIKWSRNIKRRAINGQELEFQEGGLRKSLYRPYCGQFLYFDAVMNSVPGQNPRFFPTASTSNVGFYQVGCGSAVPFSVIATDAIPDLHATGAGSGGQFFPRWTYEPAPRRAENTMLFGDVPGEVIDGYRRVDNITDAALASFREAFGPAVTKDDIFAYVYAVLHSTQYRSRFANDLKKSLPRIPMAASPEDFRSFVEAGNRLLDLHVNYEEVDPYPLREEVSAPLGADEWETFRVMKMHWGKPSPADRQAGMRDDRSVLVVNSHVVLRGIPEAAHRYQLGSRSALDWIVDRYRIRTDKKSGIVNDPNDWCREVDNPRYVVDLIEKVVRVSVETMTIVDSLPDLPLDAETPRPTAVATPPESPRRADDPPDAPTGEPVVPPAGGRGAPDALENAEVDRLEELMSEAGVGAPAPGPETQPALVPDFFAVPDDMDPDDWSDWVSSLGESEMAIHRDEIMLAGLETGATLAQVGERFGVSGEWVRQIAAARGWRQNEVRAQRRAQRERHQRRVARHVYGYSLSYPELTVSELAELVDTDEATVLKALEHRRVVHADSADRSGGGISDEDLLDAVRQWASQTSVRTSADYDAWSREHGVPGRQTVTIRFGKWNNALAMIGEGEDLNVRRGRHPQITDEELWATLYTFLREDRPSYTASAYSLWAGSEGLPSLPTLRHRLGSWNSMLATVRKLLRYAAARDGSWELGERVLAVTPGDFPRQILTEEQCLAALRAVASRISGPMSSIAYETHRTAEEPSAGAVGQRCGSWVQAMVNAGLEDRLTTKARLRLEESREV